MRRPEWLSALVAATLVAASAAAANAVLNSVVFRFDAPSGSVAVSPPRTATMYFAPDAGGIQLSMNGGAYAPLGGGTTFAFISESDGGIFMKPNTPAAAYVSGNQVLTTASTINDATKVPLAGGTMTGTLNLAGAGSGGMTMKASTNTSYAYANFLDSAGTAVGQFVYAGSAVANASTADKVYLSAQSKILALQRADNVVAGSPLLEIWNNTNGGGTKVATVDGSGNIILSSGSTRSKGTVTLSGGAATVTVSSGAICTCSDTTSAAAVRCSVSSTTLSVAGTGTDVISYLCL